MTRSFVYGLTAAVLILALGFGAGLLSGSGTGNAWFDALPKPWFMPPGWVFPIVWTTLYVLMGFALGEVLAAPPSPARRGAITLFVLQLLLNLVWPPIFFAAHRVALALGVILILDLAVLATVAAFYLIRRRAALLLLPYPAWLVIATALNLSIWRIAG